jgi:CBS domain-containing protein
MPRRMISDMLDGRSLVTATKEMTVRSACRLMTEKRIGALLVVENNRIPASSPNGMRSTRFFLPALDPDATKVSQVMVSNPQTIGVDKPLAHALYMMAEGGFRHVPVVDANGTPLGMVSARDALGQDMMELEREMKHLEELESSIGY